MSRVLARDCFAEAEVRLFSADQAPAANGAASQPVEQERPSVDPLELESLDFARFVPHLLILAAHEKAHEIIATANSEAEKIRLAAVEQGLTEGRAAAKEELSPSVAAFANAAQALIVFEQKILSDYTPELVRFALEIAEKLVGKTLNEDPTIIAAVLQRAKQEVAGAKEIRIFLHPTDFQRLSEIAPDLIQPTTAQGRKVEVLAAAEIGRGGCRLETEIGVVDATIGVQLEEIQRQLLDEER